MTHRKGSSPGRWECPLGYFSELGGNPRPDKAGREPWTRELTVEWASNPSAGGKLWASSFTSPSLNYDICERELCISVP